jgi:hypothetical protein
MAGQIIISNIKTDSDNAFSILANTGAVLFSANLASGITTGIADGSVTNAKLAGSISNDKLAGSITGNKIATGQITGNLIATNAISQNNIVSVNASVASVGTLPTARLPAGSVLQVVQTFKSDTFSSTSTSFTNVTGLSVSITPTSTSSKILVRVIMAGAGTNTTGSTYRVTRGGSAIAIADAAGSRNLGSGGEFYTGRTDTIFTFGTEFLDSPSSISSLTYAIQVIVGGGGGTVHINRSDNDTNSTSYVRGVSSITVMEIAG